MKNIFLIMIILTLASCASKSKPTITQQAWGTVDSQPVSLYTLTNSNGVMVKITNYGGIVVEFLAPDRNGIMENIVLGLGSLDDYLAGHPSFGCIVGRYANRIGKAKFTLDSVEYVLAVNNGVNHLHGGLKRFSDKVWNANTVTGQDSVMLSLTYTSADMEEGYPGNLTVGVNYILNDKNELKIEYVAATDKPTVVNLTNHSYFNLSSCREDVRNHQVKIYADKYTPVDEGNIPTGEIVPVDGTPFDLRAWTLLADRLSALPQGYDHNFCLNSVKDQPVLAAELYDPKSGRLLQTYTTEPGVQLYTSAGLDGSKKSPSGMPYTAFMGACFEAQHYPDSPNKPNFPSTVLRPGETYHQLTIYKVGAK